MEKVATVSPVTVTTGRFCAAAIAGSVQSSSAVRIIMGTSGGSQDQWTMASDDDGMLEMCSQAAIRAAHGPAIAQQTDSWIATGDDRLECDDQTALQHDTIGRIMVVQNFGSL